MSIPHNSRGSELYLKDEHILINHQWALLSLPSLPGCLPPCPGPRTLCQPQWAASPCLSDSTAGLITSPPHPSPAWPWAPLTWGYITGPCPDLSSAHSCAQEGVWYLGLGLPWWPRLSAPGWLLTTWWHTAPLCWPGIQVLLNKAPGF